MATIDVINYYANLLILQYLQQKRAYASIQTQVAPILMPNSNMQSMTFSPAPASGAFKINYNGVDTSSIAWNASAGTIQTDLNAILPMGVTVVVSGTIASGLVFTFSGETSAIIVLVVDHNTLVDGLSNPSLTSVTPIGAQIPIEVENAFSIVALPTAVGTQLDVIGKYVGVTRTGFGFSGPITLDDDDFLTLIQMAIVRNRSGSSLATIQLLLNQFFAGEIYVFDFADMNMSYLINTSIGSQDLIQLFVTENLLPKPMGVGVSVVAAPVIDKFFAFRTYDAPAWVNTTPFQTYDAYDTSWLWLNYDDGI